MAGLWAAYRMRWKRRRLLFRAFRARGALVPVADRTRALPRDAILCLAAVRDEAVRLPRFLDHHRRLGVDHFLIVDNASTDGTAELLAGATDVSVWRTEAGYKAARFGMDWLTWLAFRHGHGRWCLTLDADEFLIYPQCDSRSLRDLTRHLDAAGRRGMGALMLDMYPEGRIGAAPYAPGEDPFARLCWFDPGPWRQTRQAPMRNLWVQGGARERAFFAAEPRRSPTLNKLPLVRWDRRYTYTNSTHAMLPPRMNLLYDGPGASDLSGVLLHAKFLDLAPGRAAVEKARGEHFSNSSLYDAYYDAVAADPVLHHPGSVRYRDWRQLEELGLMSRGGWS